MLIRQISGRRHPQMLLTSFVSETETQCAKRRCRLFSLGVIHLGSALPMGYTGVHRGNFIPMVVNRILYQASQSDFRQDVLVHQFVPKMLDAADKLGVHPGEPEIRSWQANSLQIKDLLELAGVQGTYVTMEYKVPYSQKRIDCMLYGRGCDNHNHVVHIEMKQWENKGVRPAESNGNFDVEQDIDDDYLVDAFTGGRNQSVAHPSQQVRGYNQYLENFVEIYTNPAEDTHLQGIAYCYNYRKGGKPDVLFDPKYARLLKEFRTYAGNEVVELAATLRQWLGSGEGLSIFNKVQRSPIHPSSKLLESEIGRAHV